MTAILRLAHNRKDPARSGSSYDHRQANRVAVSFPSPDKSREGWYLSLFFVEFSACLALLFWQEVINNTADGWLETVIAIARGMEPLVIVLTAATVILVEGYSMLAERYLKRRYREGHVEGRVEGRVEERQRWMDWNERRQQALDEGRPFDEPPPSPLEAHRHAQNNN